MASQRDFIDSYLEWSENVPSPPLFRLWSAIACVAGALERRVWVHALSKPTFANLFTLLVAAPGIGKGIIDDTQWLWSKVKRLHTAPDSVTSASLLDALLESKRVILPSSNDGEGITAANGHPYMYHSLLVAAEELGVLIPQHDLEFLSRLNKIYTNPELPLRVKRKYIKEEIVIERPNMNILAGSQPGYLMSLLPEEAWVMGFTQRLIMIYASEGPQPELFTEEPERETRGKELVKAVDEMSQLYGCIPWEHEAAAKLQSWHRAGGPPKPTHLRLFHYNRRRTQFLIKLIMVSAVSRRPDELAISPFDFDRALAWLLLAEKAMPDVFREMTQKSDSFLLQELVLHVFNLSLRENRRPIHRMRCMSFLAERAPSERVPKLLQLAEEGGFLVRTEGDCFLPRRDPGMEIH